jgi:flagellar basal-body rod protein FlgB
MATDGIFSKIFDTSIDSVGKAMNLFWKRNQVIGSNVANVETPLYRAAELDFAGELDRAFKGTTNSNLKTTNNKHMDLTQHGNARIVNDYSGTMKADGNNVDLDLQMAKLVQNGGRYSASSTVIRKKMQMLKFAIQQAMH